MNVDTVDQIVWSWKNLTRIDFIFMKSTQIKSVQKCLDNTINVSLILVHRQYSPKLVTSLLPLACLREFMREVGLWNDKRVILLNRLHIDQFISCEAKSCLL